MTLIVLISSGKKSRWIASTGHEGSLPLIGVNTLLPKEHAGDVATTIELIRSTEEEKQQQISNVEAYRENRNGLAPESLKRLRQAARERKNVFAQFDGGCQI